MGERERVSEACARFPGTLRLRNHVGEFRVSEPASFVNRFGEVELYTQRLWSRLEFKTYYGREPHDKDELWVDFARGTEGELRAQIIRGG